MNWKEYFQKQTVKVLTETFESDLSIPQIIDDYNKLYNKIKRYAGKVEVQALEKYTYEIMVGLRPQIPKTPHLFKIEYVWNMLETFAIANPEVGDILLDYIDGKITLKTLNKKIKEFKETNVRYLNKGGSK